MQDRTDIQYGHNQGYSHRAESARRCSRRQIKSVLTTGPSGHDTWVPEGSSSECESWGGFCSNPNQGTWRYSAHVADLNGCVRGAYVFVLCLENSLWTHFKKVLVLNQTHWKMVIPLFYDFGKNCWNPYERPCISIYILAVCILSASICKSTLITFTAFIILRKSYFAVYKPPVLLHNLVFTNKNEQLNQKILWHNCIFSPYLKYYI